MTQFHSSNGGTLALRMPSGGSFLKQHGLAVPRPFSFSTTLAEAAKSRNHPAIDDSTAFSSAFLPAFVRTRHLDRSLSGGNYFLDWDRNICGFESPSNSTFMPCFVLGFTWNGYAQRSFVPLSLEPDLFKMVSEKNRAFIKNIERIGKRLGIKILQKQETIAEDRPAEIDPGWRAAAIACELHDPPLTIAPEFFDIREKQFWVLVDRNRYFPDPLTSGSPSERISRIYSEMWEYFRSPERCNYSVKDVLLSFCTLGRHAGFRVQRDGPNHATIFSELPSVNYPIPLGLRAYVPADDRFGSPYVSWLHHCPA